MAWPGAGAGTCTRRSWSRARSLQPATLSPMPPAAPTIAAPSRLHRLVPRLRCEEEESCSRPQERARLSAQLPRHLCALLSADADGVAHCAQLLRHQRLGRREEGELAAREPARQVEHHNGGYERLAHAGGQAGERVVLQRRVRDRALVRPHRHVCRVEPRLRCHLIERRHAWRSLARLLRGAFVRAARPIRGVCTGGGQPRRMRRAS
eukprot:3909469-Pleurochrysis_carterae.AAC.1